MPHISVVTPTYNEEENVNDLYEKIKEQFALLPNYTYEHIFIDNSSIDNTVALIKEIITHDKNIRLIVNSRNFGHIRSPFHGILQSHGDATILMASDLQDPPELIPQFLKKWEEGFKIVKAVKGNSEEMIVLYMLRKCFYAIINRLSNIKLTKNYTGTGLYDKQVIDALKRVHDPYPYFRGLISEVGYTCATVTFFQPTRKRGITKNNFYTLYDMAMLGITNHTRVPLRLMTFCGFVFAGLSLLCSFVFLGLKLYYWDRFQAGMTPVLLGVFFFFSIQLFFMGILGEYIGNIYTQVQNRPHVFEKERVNFPTSD